MKKILAFILLTGFLVSCASSTGSYQTWLPKQHKRQDLSKPLKRN